MSSQLSLGKYIKFRHICMLFLLSKDLLNWQADAQNPHGRPVQYQGSDVSEECIQGGGGGGDLECAASRPAWRAGACGGSSTRCLLAGIALAGPLPRPAWRPLFMPLLGLRFGAKPAQSFHGLHPDGSVLGQNMVCSTSTTASEEANVASSATALLLQRSKLTLVSV